MKRFKRLKGKKGFTLLETLLAAAILVIVSSMLISGFMATMGYSANTSAYVKAAGGNYSSVSSDLATWTALGTTDYNIAVGSAAGAGGGAGAGATTLTFTGGSAGSSIKTINVHNVNKKDMKDVNGVSITKFNIDNTVEESTRYASHRDVFAYYPTYMGTGSSDPHYGKYVVVKETATGKFFWGYLDDATGKYKKTDVEITKG